VGLEHFGLWPDWAKAERIPRRFWPVGWRCQSQRWTEPILFTV